MLFSAFPDFEDVSVRRNKVLTTLIRDHNDKLSSTSRSQGADASASRHDTSCNTELKLGDSCDSCWRGIMIPPGGISYYVEEIAKYGNTRHPVGQKKLVCPRCGHWHISIGLNLRTGSGTPNSR